MKELSEIVRAFESLSREGKPSALATVIGVRGSAYRRPGARMLIAGDGRCWGGVSGGCLERDVARIGRGVIDVGQPIHKRYDADAAAGAGEPGASTGCGGSIDVFIQRLTGDRPGPVPVFARVLQTRRPEIAATLLRTRDPARRNRIGVCRSVAIASGLRPPASGESEAGTEPRIIHGARGDWFVEPLRPPQELILFGAGRDVTPLVGIARTLGWRVVIVAERPSAELRERCVDADAIRFTSNADPLAGVKIAPESAVVCMSHDLARDAAVLGALRGPLRYLGLLGPIHRADRLLDELPGRRVAGVEARCWHSPVGLDIGAAAPEEIALAIAAEILSAARGASARPLRSRRDRSQAGPAPHAIDLAPARQKRPCPA